jgi:hypothetical protein
MSATRAQNWTRRRRAPGGKFSNRCRIRWSPAEAIQGAQITRSRLAPRISRSNRFQVGLTKVGIASGQKTLFGSGFQAPFTLDLARSSRGTTRLNENLLLSRTTNGRIGGSRLRITIPAQSVLLELNQFVIVNASQKFLFQLRPVHMRITACRR